MAVAIDSSLSPEEKARKIARIKCLYYVIGAAMVLVPCSAVGCFFLYIYAYCAMETVYAPGYSRRAFAEVRPGMHAADVLSMLGEPIMKREWSCEPRWVFIGNGGKALMGHSEHIDVSEGIKRTLVNDLNRWRLSYAEFKERCGGELRVEPLRVATWWYSVHCERNGSYLERKVIIDIDAGLVIDKVAGLYWD